MWSLAGNQAVELISQSSSFVLGTRKWRLQPLWLGRCARSRGIQPLWVCDALKQLCAWGAQPADPAAWAWVARELAADSADLGLGRSQVALFLENAHPAGPALGERAAGRASGPVLGGPIQPPWA